MGYIIGYLLVPFGIAFLIVYFGISKRYEKKHGMKYSIGKSILYTILIGLGLLLLSIFGRMG